MANITKIDLSRQSKLNELSLSEISDLIEDGETLLYKREDGSLGMATKTGGIVEDINPGGDVIKNLPIPSLPPTSAFPDVSEGYALCAVRDGFNFKLVWALVDTKINYNVT
jgi:hypothetical protein